MTGEKFTLMQYSVSAILGLIDAGDFVIPEIQRPFVWKRSQVRDLIDSLYNGSPLYNFIKSILSDESAVLRHLSVHRILFGFRCFGRK